MKVDHADVNGERIAFRRDGSGPPVVLLHNLGTGGAVWRGQIAALRGRYTLIAVDCRGHGGSTGRQTFTLNAAAEDVKALMETLSFEPAHVVGLSAMGGRVALSLYALAPGAFRSLVLADTNTLPPPKTISRISETMNRLENMTPDGYREFALKYAEDTLLPETPPDVRDDLVSIILATPPKNYLAALRANPKADLNPVLATVQVPTLVLVGEHDWRTPISCSEHIANSIAGARLEVIPNAGHLSNLDNPEAFNAAVAAFLDSQPRP